MLVYLRPKDVYIESQDKLERRGNTALGRELELTSILSTIMVREVCFSGNYSNATHTGRYCQWQR